MIGVIETYKYDAKSENIIELEKDKYSNESYRTKSQTGQNALVERVIYAEAIEIMGKTSEDMEKETELEDKKFKLRKLEFQMNTL